MKAVVCKELGGTDVLHVEDVASPAPRRGEVVVQVVSAGVNFPDVLMIAGKYQFQVPPPFVPGHEFAGTIIEVGEGVDDLELGQRVVGNAPWGAFAERISVVSDAVIPLPDDISFDQGAAMLLTYATSHYALKDRGRLRRDETVVILGAAGGVGIAAVQLAKTMGARVIAAASSEEKLRFCREQGADEAINYATEDLKERIKDLTGGHGADIVYDPVGGSLTEQALRATNWDGRLLVVGFASGEIPKVPLNLPLLKGCQILGVFWGSFIARSPDLHREYVQEIFEWTRQGLLRPHIDRVYGFEDAGRALSDLSERRVRGKVLLRPDTDPT
ncbi:MAG: NADPH:quinone oxidoreductase family protein [Myxococcota bacterium]